MPKRMCPYFAGLCVYINTYSCINTCIYREREKEIEGERGRETEGVRERERETEGERERERERATKIHEVRGRKKGGGGECKLDANMKLEMLSLASQLPQRPGRESGGPWSGSPHHPDSTAAGEEISPSSR